jgi:hypothetical protein
MGSSSSVLDVVDAFKTLRSRDVALDDHSFWKPFFTSVISPVELFAIVPPKLLRDLRLHRPCSLAALIFKCTEQLMVFASLGSKAGEPRSALNALALLSRVIPFAVEPARIPPNSVMGSSAANGEGSVGVALIESSEENGNNLERLDVSFFSENFAHHVFVEGLRCSADGSLLPQLPGGEPLNVALVRAMVDLCFIPGFTIGPYQDPSTTRSGANVDGAVLWAAGFGSVPDTSYANADASAAHRRAVLTTFLVILSVPMYSEEAISAEPLFRDILTLGVPSPSGEERVPLPLGSSLFASLWNVVTGYDPRGSLPYTSHITSDHEGVVCLAAQVLGACMDYSPLLCSPPIGEDQSREAQRSEEASGPPQAASGSLLKSVPWGLMVSCSASDAKMVLGGLCHLIENQTYARSTYLPHSQRRFPIFDEFVMLLWKLVDRCPPFRAAVVQASTVVPRSPQQPVVGLGMLVPLMDYAFGVRERPQHLFQQLQITLFILQRVTAERDFCLLCNTPFNQYIPFDFPAFSGTYNDFVVIGMTTLMLLPSPFLTPFHESMAHIVSNVAPFMTVTSSIVAEKLLKVLQHWRSHDVLRSRPGPSANRNPYTLALVVEAMATLLQYQYPGSFPLAVELSKHEASIAQLAGEYRTLELPLPEALHGQLLIPTLHCAATAMAKALEAERNGAPNVSDMESFRRRTTLVGSLPIPHQILSRRVDSGYSTDAWLTKVFWGAVFLHSVPGTLVDYKAIRLFATAASL